MDPMAVLLDVAVVAVLVFFVWRGWHKGLLLSLCGLAVILVAFFGAGFLADTLEPTVDKFLEPKLDAMIEENLTSYMAEHYDDKEQKSPADALREMGGLYAWAVDVVEDAGGQVSGALTDHISAIAADAAKAISAQLAHSLLFLASFLILTILCTLLLHALDLVAKLPVLHTFNELGGGIIGLGKAVLVLFVLTCFLPMAAQWIPPEAVKETKILSVFVSINPVLSLFH